MRQILKGDVPVPFQQWRQKNRTANWQDFSGSDIYQALRETLIKQQGQMCCYCEVAITANIDAHIEHIKDKDSSPQLLFDFANLLASCQYNDCCGHKKGNGYFADMVTPLQSDCQSRFIYTGSGEIHPLDEEDSFAYQTIELLALNCNRLKDRRQSIIKALDPAFTDALFLQQSLDHCIGWYNGFYSLIKYMANK
ncbi:MAG: hypothetical protein ACI8WB_005808 [Phenylobacterium sp.]|jgi:uncharacterized protein (TIGR02646 family)